MDTIRYRTIEPTDMKTTQNKGKIMTTTICLQSFVKAATVLIAIAPTIAQINNEQHRVKKHEQHREIQSLKHLQRPVEKQSH